MQKIGIFSKIKTAKKIGGLFSALFFALDVLNFSTFSVFFQSEIVPREPGNNFRLFIADFGPAF